MPIVDSDIIMCASLVFNDSSTRHRPKLQQVLVCWADEKMIKLSLLLFNSNSSTLNLEFNFNLLFLKVSLPTYPFKYKNN